MSKNFRITEEQYNKLMDEGVTLSADVSAANGNVKQAIDTTKQEAQKNGVDLSKATIEIPGNAEIGESKSVVISKRTLIENRLKVLKENSVLYSVKDFIKSK